MTQVMLVTITKMAGDKLSPPGYHSVVLVTQPIQTIFTFFTLHRCFIVHILLFQL